MQELYRVIARVTQTELTVLIGGESGTGKELVARIALMRQAVDPALLERARLAAEGLFDPGRKRPLPRFVRRVAVVTSPSGAAIRDFLEVLRRRWRAIQCLRCR